MAVYTRVSTEDIAQFLTDFDAGTLRSAKGIAEGVENSNYLIETTTDRFILTLYEKRVDPGDLPFFVDLLDHLAAMDVPVPPMIASRSGEKIHRLKGKYACLIKFLSGLSASMPTPAQARSTGIALGNMHRALSGFDQQRRNSMGHDAWRPLATSCGDAGLDAIYPGLAEIVHDELQAIDQQWPDDLPHSVVHADLFPDNVLMLGDQVTGLIDFYFSCSDIRAYDLAVTHAAWCFADDGSGFDRAIGSALIDGYQSRLALSAAEAAALPILARGAAMRFLLSRAYDWINTPADALVTRKDPIAFLRRLQFYQQHPEIFRS